MTEREQQTILLAEKAMGWKRKRTMSGWPQAFSYIDEQGKIRLISWNDDIHLTQVDCWDPFVSIGDAWMLVDALRARGLWFKLVTPWSAKDIDYCAGFTEFETVDCGSSWVRGRAPTVCEAICAAALDTLAAAPASIEPGTPVQPNKESTLPGAAPQGNQESSYGPPSGAGASPRNEETVSPGLSYLVVPAFDYCLVPKCGPAAVTASMDPAQGVEPIADDRVEFAKAYSRAEIEWLKSQVAQEKAYGAKRINTEICIALAANERAEKAEAAAITAKREQFPMQALIAKLTGERDEARERLNWIACASRDEIEQMLMHSAAEDVEDLCRWIDAAIAKEPA